MKILAIETSCDETAVAVLDCEGGLEAPSFRVLSSAVSSQMELHAQFGGVVPNLAKREHQRNLVPVLDEALTDAGVVFEGSAVNTNELTTILDREQDLLAILLPYLKEHGRPGIDAIAVTHGPGLEPALWVGVNFSKALAFAWDKPLVPVNHMEGHILAALLRDKEFSIFNFQFSKKDFPILSLLVSGGHTELVLSSAIGEYALLGATRDDAAGECFDKVARMLGLPYPGGPAIEDLAPSGIPDPRISLPRPMLYDKTLDFSFSGLKTAVLYLVRKLEASGELDARTKANIALEFVSAVVDVLVGKTLRALEETGAQSLILGGGVAASTYLREEIRVRVAENCPDTAVFLPKRHLTTDNAAMIGAAGYLRFLRGDLPAIDTIVANGNMRLAQERTRT